MLLFLYLIGVVISIFLIVLFNTYISDEEEHFELLFSFFSWLFIILFTILGIYIYFFVVYKEIPQKIINFLHTKPKLKIKK